MYGTRMDMDSDFLEIDHVTKRYETGRGEAIRAVDDLTFTSSRGEFVAIVGSSGCGKTTLLKLVGGLIPITSGTIRIDGETIQRDGEVLRSKAEVDYGIVFQKPSLFQWKTVLENVLSPISLTGRAVGDFRERARNLLEMVGIGDFQDRYPQELSGGMQQRASICRALIHDPTILLMDEPFGALDALTRDELNVELLRIWRESQKTVLFVTHNIEEAIFLADRILVLTPRPARVESIVDVNLPRPRTIEMRGESDFGELKQDIYQYFTVEEEPPDGDREQV